MRKKGKRTKERKSEEEEKGRARKMKRKMNKRKRRKERNRGVSLLQRLLFRVIEFLFSFRSNIHEYICSNVYVTDPKIESSSDQVSMTVPIVSRTSRLKKN